MRAGQLQGNTPATEGWMRVVGLNVDGVSDDEKVTVAYEIVADFRRLLDRIDLQFAEYATSDSFKTVTARYRVIANAQYVHGAWDAIQRQLFAEQNVVVLELIAGNLPDEVAPTDFDSAQSLLSDVESLLKDVAASDLPAYHKHYARMMLERLRAALRNYILFGSQAVHEYAAFLHGLDADIAANASAFTKEHVEISETGQSLINRVMKTTSRVTDWSKSVYYVGGATAMLYHATEKVLPLLLR